MCSAPPLKPTDLHFVVSARPKSNPKQPRPVRKSRLQPMPTPKSAQGEGRRVVRKERGAEHARERGVELPGKGAADHYRGYIPQNAGPGNLALSVESAPSASRKTNPTMKEVRNSPLMDKGNVRPSRLRGRPQWAESRNTLNARCLPGLADGRDARTGWLEQTQIYLNCVISTEVTMRPSVRRLRDFRVKTVRLQEAPRVC